MTTEFTKDVLTAGLRKALELVESQFAALNALDAATGDGDHGTAIESTLKAAVAASESGAGLASALSDVAMGVMSATGGSTSSLYGSFFMGMDAPSESLDAAQTVAMFRAGLNSLQTMTNAKVGDKTMMDAMIPAIEAMESTIGANAGASLSDVMRAAADAAKSGAEKTAEYVAKFGRARNLGERSKGTADAGATSLALIFQAFAEVVA